MCSEMHNIKDAIYENKRKMEAICEDYQIQVSIFFTLTVFSIFVCMWIRFMKEACDKCIACFFFIIIIIIG